ncbi:hypothetical protein RAS1_21580 [Phycisphaerae bacterium RAS1]|nr:hypothetical protein RAS1_21580 [Phycisphaerae bacterium RAS1]
MPTIARIGPYRIYFFSLVVNRRMFTWIAMTVRPSSGSIRSRRRIRSGFARKSFATFGGQHATEWMELWNDNFGPQAR